jgi:methylmalonyl-CoA/ethylmalonyl-CoA epimerase
MGMLKKIDHIGIVVRNLDDALKTYKTAFDLDPIRQEEIEETKLKIAFIQVGEVLIEFLEPMEPGFGMIGEFLDKKGEGIHHIAYRVEDIETAMEKIRKVALPLMHEGPQDGADASKIAFMEAAFTQNVLTELVERKREVA